MSCNVLITADRLVKAVLFSVAYTLQARQFRNLSVVFDKFEVAKCLTTNNLMANGKHFPFLRLLVKIVVRFTLRLNQIKNPFNSFTADTADEVREIRTI